MQPYTDVEQLLNAEGRPEFFNMTAHMEYAREVGIYVPVRFSIEEHPTSWRIDVLLCKMTSHVMRWSPSSRTWGCRRCFYRPW